MSFAQTQPNTEAIPQQLRTHRQWLLWRYEDNGKPKPDKVPYQADGQRASHSDPDTWTDFKTGCRHAPDFDGIGFVFADGVTGVDLDDCADPTTREAHPDAWEVVKELDSYAEWSPNGKGLHVICFGEVPKGRRLGRTPWGGNLEVHSRDRFFTTTDAHVEGTPTEPQERGYELGQFHSQWWPKKKAKRKPPSGSPVLIDDKVLAKVRAAGNARKCEALWGGDTSRYPSASEADQALCGVLAFYTSDAAQLERLVRQSALAREKRDEPRGEETRIGRECRLAIEDCAEHWSPGGDEPVRNAYRRRFPRSDDTRAQHHPRAIRQTGGVGLRFSWAVLPSRSSRRS